MFSDFRPLGATSVKLLGLMLDITIGLYTRVEKRDHLDHFVLDKMKSLTNYMLNNFSSVGKYSV